MSFLSVWMSLVLAAGSPVLSGSHDSPKTAPPKTFTQMAVAAAGMNHKSYVSISGSILKPRRLYVDLNTDPEGTAKLVCDELDDGHAKRKCTSDLAEAIENSKAKLQSDLVELSTNNIIGVIELKLDGGVSSDPEVLTLEPKILKHRIVQGQLGLVSKHAHQLCEDHRASSRECDSMKMNFFEAYVSAEENALITALDVVSNFASKSQSTTQDEGMLGNEKASCIGFDGGLGDGKNKSSCTDGLIRPVDISEDLNRASEHLKQLFKSLKETRKKSYDYHIKRRNAHIISQRDTRLVVGELRRKIALLEAEADALRNGRHGEEQKHSLKLKPIRRFNANDMKYADYLRIASRSEPFILVTGAPLVGDASKIVPGVPHWSHSRIRQACAGKNFTLKVTEQNPDEASGFWARLKGIGEYAIESFLSLLEADVSASSMATFPVETNGVSSENLRDAYLHDSPLSRSCPNLLDDILVPAFFASDFMQRTPKDLDYNWNGYRNYWPSMFVGPGGRSSSALHADWCDTAAWMGLYQGRKHWRIVPPGDRHLLHESAERINTFPTDIFKPDFSAYPTLSMAKVYDGIMHPGDIIFIPAGSAHQVRNLPGDPTIAVAMNYVDIVNVDQFLARAVELSTSAGESAYSWLTKVIESFKSMDMTRDRAMLSAALEGGSADDMVKEPISMTYEEFKAGRQPH